ncbi:MAG TPA: hypothetical protein ENJ24_01770 [Gammaproteobacteria bacterium]|nr:hypothetical protein [Gammaproteobacteria bacterium]
MPAQDEPEVGNWYSTLDGEQFRVVAINDDDETIDIQYFNGDVDEMTLDTWYETELEQTAAPEDWSGPFDDLVADDFGDTEKPLHFGDGNNPLDVIEPEEI